MLRMLSAPVLFALELTPVCNNRCAGCLNVFASRGYSQKALPPLDLAGWSSLLKKLAPHAQRLKLTGGEPTLHPQFAEIVRCIEQLGIEFTVFSNARWIDPAGLLDLFTQAQWMKGLLVSLHGARPRSHDAFTGVQGSFEEAVANIQGASGRGLDVTISSVLTRHNLTEIEDLTELAARFGAHHVVFNRYLGSTNPPIMPAPDELAAAVRRIGELRRQGHPVKFGNCIPQCFIPNDSSGCLAGVAYCAIDPWGRLRPCTNSPLVAGNLLSQELGELWSSPAMMSFRQSIPPGCHHCDAFVTCHGGCRAAGAADPLLDSSKAPQVAAQPPISLHPGLHPIGRFTMHREGWGLALLRGNRVIPLRQAASPLLDMLDGESTLADIEMRFGTQGLSLVGNLHQKGMVILV